MELSVVYVSCVVFATELPILWFPIIFPRDPMICLWNSSICLYRYAVWDDRIRNPPRQMVSSWEPRFGRFLSKNKQKINKNWAFSGFLMLINWHSLLIICLFLWTNGWNPRMVLDVAINNINCYELSFLKYRSPFREPFPGTLSGIPFPETLSHVSGSCHVFTTPVVAPACCTRLRMGGVPLQALWVFKGN